MTLKAVKAHTWLYPHRALFRTPITDFESQAKESISLLSATPMGRSVSAQEPAHTSYIAPSASHLISHTAKTLSPTSSPELPTLTADPRRHTVQLEYDRPMPIREEIAKPAKNVSLEVPGATTRPKKEEDEVSSFAIPPAPMLARSATTGAATRPTILEPVEERSPEKTRKEARQEARSPSDTTVVSRVAKAPGPRPTMPHGSKPRPTSYHPTSTGGFSMAKNRSTSGDRTSALIIQHRSSSGSGSSRKYNEPSPTAPIATTENVTGEIIPSKTPPQQLTSPLIPASATQPADEPIVPPIQRTKTHKRASASISMVADKVFGFFTTKPVSPTSSPARRTSRVYSVSETMKSKDGVSRSNTTTRRSSVLGGVPGATVLSKRKEKPNTPSKSSITRSVTENVLSSSPKPAAKPTHPKSIPLIPDSPSSKMSRSRTDAAINKTVPEHLPTRRTSENLSPKMTKPVKKLGEYGPDKGSTGPARRVMEFFRRRAREFST
jgi:hypothetical protein